MEIREVKKGIYYFENTTNIPLFETDEGFVIFDSPIDKDKAKKVRKLLDEIGFKPKFLILSHHHADHTGGACFLKETFILKFFQAKLRKLLLNHRSWSPFIFRRGQTLLMNS